MASVDLDAIGQFNPNAPDSDAYRHVGKSLIDRLRTGDAFHVDTVQDMVTRIERRLGEGLTIRRLRIYGHGNPGTVSLGVLRHAHYAVDGSLQIDGVTNTHLTDDVNRLILLTPSGAVLSNSTLPRLRRRFESGGWCELHVCKVARGERGLALLRALARLWGVNVIGGDADQVAEGGIEGNRYVAEPSGHTRRL